MKPDYYTIILEDECEIKAFAYMVALEASKGSFFRTQSKSEAIIKKDACKAELYALLDEVYPEFKGNPKTIGYLQGRKFHFMRVYKNP